MKDIDAGDGVSIKNTGRKATGNHLSISPKTMARQNIGVSERSIVCGIKEKGGKQERMENMEAKNLRNDDELHYECE